MACEGAGAGGETGDGQCRVSVHYEGEGEPGTGHTKTGVLHWQMSCTRQQNLCLQREKRNGTLSKSGYNINIETYFIWTKQFNLFNLLIENFKVSSMISANIRMHGSPETCKQVVDYADLCSEPEVTWWGRGLLPCEDATWAWPRGATPRGHRWWCWPACRTPSSSVCGPCPRASGEFYPDKEII